MTDGAPGPRPVPDGIKEILLIVLASAAGGMDALSILGLGNVFCSALSGNTVLLGISLYQGHVNDAILGSLVFVGFIPGAIMTAFILRKLEKGSPWGLRVTGCLALELAILTAMLLGLIIIGNGSNDLLLLAPLVLLSSMGMGMQYMAMQRLNIKGVATTFVTSTIVNLACRLVVREQEVKVVPGPTFAIDDGAPPGKDRTNRFLASVWGAYFLGALFSAALMSSSRIAAALLVVSLVMVVVLTAWTVASTSEDIRTRSA